MCPAAFDLSIHSILKIEIRSFCDTAVSLCQEIRALAVDYRMGRANSGAGRLRRGCAHSMSAELALYDLGINLVPFKFGNVERTCNLAVTAPDAESGIPAYYSKRFLMQGFHRAAGNTGGIYAMHALLLDKRALVAIRRNIKFYEVFCTGVQSLRLVIQPTCIAGVRCQAVFVLTGRHAGAAPDASCGVIH